MSVNRDPKVGDRFTWGEGRPAVRVVTRVEDDYLYYTYDSDSLEYIASFEEWRAEAGLVDPEPDVPAVGTEFKWNGRRWDDRLRKVRTVRHVDPEHDAIMWADTDGKVGTVPLSQWEQRAQLPDSETPPEWPGSAFLAWGLSGFWYVPHFPAGDAKDGNTVYEVEPLPGGKALLHPLRKDGGRW